MKQSLLVDDIRSLLSVLQYHDRGGSRLSGRIESYEYAELAYGLFHLGFDV